MTDKRALVPAAQAISLRVGMVVRTPAGRHAQVVRIDAAHREAVIEWPDHERATFKICLLRLR